ncbi:MAG: hypothetical protein KatS3mg105_0886 [Gemmatales bacterium]|nr:MAG: hypothetical protein KatS3mg105_0886 [Gemmatales bacterium]
MAIQILVLVRQDGTLRQTSLMARPEQTVRQLLDEVIWKLGLPRNPPVWLVHFAGKVVRLDQRLDQLAKGKEKITLELRAIATPTKQLPETVERKPQADRETVSPSGDKSAALAKAPAETTAEPKASLAQEAILPGASEQKTISPESLVKEVVTADDRATDADAAILSDEVAREEQISEGVEAMSDTFTGEAAPPLSAPPAAPAPPAAAPAPMAEPLLAKAAATAVAPPAASPPHKVERHATVRYYSRMNPQQIFPLLVVISEKDIVQIGRRNVAQSVSDRFQVALGSRVEVEPILPGCDCYPAKREVRIGSGRVEARFCVVPNVLGKIPDAHVALTQNGFRLAEIPLEVKVVRQTVAWMMCAAGVFMPIISAVMQYFGIDFETQAQRGFSFYTRLLQFLFNALTPEFLAGFFLTCAVIAYLLFRPKRREQFWDIQMVSPEEMLELGKKKIESGHYEEGAAMIHSLLRTHPDYQPAWLACAYLHYENQDFAEALRCYERGMELGQLGSEDCQRAVDCAARLGQPQRAEHFRRHAQAALTATK